MTMRPYGDNFILVIPVEDELIHTDLRPFCLNPSCGCHEDLLLIGEGNEQYQNGSLTQSEATRLIEGKQL